MKTRQPVRRFWNAVLVGLIIFIASACQATGQTPATSSEDLGTEEIVGQDIELVLGPGTFFLDDPRVGLADLSGYTATLTRSFEGSVSGESQQWSETYVLLRDNGSAASQLSYSISGDIAADPVFFAEVGQNSYEKSGAAACSASEIDSEISSIERIDPAGLLSVLLGAEEGSQEEVNGVLANHYTFDERALGKADLEDSSGEILVATDGGYILKYTLTTAGADAAFGEGIEGTMTWNYALTEINTTVLPSLPEGCQLNAPLLADATNVLHTPYWLAYSTSTSIADATAFYQNQLPSIGWTPSSGPFSTEENTFMEFAQGDQTIGVFISVGETGTDVNIVLYDAGK
jgi:hypothetical protein